ncbi:MAG TPA: hypothetical protein VER17_19950, partial [Tepidisphaeraceae bacterium]|nr:hypothetical protein [Tepidisphaeraceae bacterium]
ADPANGGAAPAAPRAADSVDLGAAPAGAAGVPDVSPRPPAFLVTCEERENDRWSPLQVTSVSRTGGEADAVVTITGAGRAGTTSVAVTFVQDARTGTARFLVQRQRRMRARPLAGAQSSDLVQLFNDHQPETRLYLVPLLAELGRGDLLRPRPGDVYRAFPSIPPDPKVSRQVRDLLPALDSTESTERDAAVAKVEALGAPALLAVARLDPSELTPEQSSRLGALLARHSTWTDPAAAARDPDFLVDCLEDDDPAVRAAALDALRPLARREVRFDPAAAPEQRARAAASIREALRTPAPEPAAAE